MHVCTLRHSRDATCRGPTKQSHAHASGPNGANAGRAWLYQQPQQPQQPRQPQQARQQQQPQHQARALHEISTAAEAGIEELPIRVNDRVFHRHRRMDAPDKRGLVKEERPGPNGKSFLVRWDTYGETVWMQEEDIERILYTKDVVDRVRRPTCQQHRSTRPRSLFFIADLNSICKCRIRSRASG